MSITKNYYIFLSISSLVAVVAVLGFSAPSSVKLNIQPSFNTKILTKNQWYISALNDSILFSKVQFYLTDFRLKTKEGNIYKLKDSNYLVDLFKPETLTIPLSIPKLKAGTELSVTIGVPSSLHTAGALSGDLDPSKGMYWSWQSGFINFKIEGVSPRCKTRKNKFQFHIGGYKKPYNTEKRLSFTLDGDSLNLDLKLESFFDSVPLSITNQVMVPGQKANELAIAFSKTFTSIE